ncbi:Uma2 family endonuclease [Moorena sp. SIO1G6]|uniref:Uma2 family endonuclease n=1 Tax=Moorena sp. SIO1G6 TaxID=2607840 RepID=UPI00338E35C3
MGWVVWEEQGRYPDVIIEMMSPSTKQVDTGKKKSIYCQTFRTPNYFVYQPFDPDSLQGWYLDIDNGYQELTPNEQGWLWCQPLVLCLGPWSGTIEDRDENLVPLPEESAEQRGKKLAERLRQAGIDPDEI